MTKVEINGKTYCVETLIYTVERLTKEVKASSEYHKLVLDNIRAEIVDLDGAADYDYEGYYKAVTDAVKIIDKYKAESKG